MNGRNAQRIWVSVRRLVGSIQGRPRESVDEIERSKPAQRELPSSVREALKQWD